MPADDDDVKATWADDEPEAVAEANDKAAADAAGTGQSPEHRAVRRALGKLPPVVPPRALRLAAYAETLMNAPEVCDASGGDLEWGDLGNTDVGDCTIAAAMHMQQAVQTVRYQKTPVFTTADAISYHGRWNGYVPGNASSDQGGVLSDVLANWLREGLKSHHVVAYGYLDPKDHDAVRHFVAAFGGLMVGVEVPNKVLSEDVWDVARQDNDGGIAGGHCVYVFGYDADYLHFVSWGRKMRMTWAFWDDYCDEAWGVLLAAHVRDGKSVAGVDARTLEADAERHLRRG